MMKKQFLVRWCILLVIVATGLSNFNTPASAQDAITASYSDLAQTGNFQQLLDRLNQSHTQSNNRSVLSLIDQVQLYKSHTQENLSKRRESYNLAITQVAEHLQAGELEDALISANEAHSFADIPDFVVSLNLVSQLIEQAQQAAITAEKQGDWIQTQTLYRLLELLFNGRNDYRQMRQRASRHVRALRLYAPKRFQDLQHTNAIRRGKSQDQVPVTIPENWQKLAKGANLQIFKQTISRSTNFYVGSTNYQQLLFGAIDSVITLINIQGAEQSFPTLTDRQAMEKMQRFLLGLKGIVQRQPGISYKQSLSIIDSIILMNNKTINLPETAIYYELTEGATSKLDDFSAVIWPSEQEHFSRTIEGKYYGVGIHIQMKERRLTVISPIANSPAQRAGIRTNDTIVTVDGKDCSTWTLSQAVREITGPVNTQVLLGVERPGEHDILQISLKRAEILIESILGWNRNANEQWNYYIDQEKTIGYVRITQFIKQTADDLDEAINQLEQDGNLQALIIDLRFNPGGLLRSAIDISDRFIAHGPIVSTRDAMGRQTSLYSAKPQNTMKDIPLIVLVNQGSASASEIVAGALQDHDRAWIVGQRTYGKGSVQDPYAINSNPLTILKLTTQYYALPKGRIIHRHPDDIIWGIEPNLSVKMTEQQVADAIEFRRKADIIHNKDNPASTDQPPVTALQILNQGIDPQLEAAMLILKTKLVTQNLELAHANSK